ncbi:MAG: phosphotransferase [SAR202 cluster bacterium]|jgi:Ser/Thr protein kinase RdoA (MazF antagonist)|nr:phosphotransferase [SAR202 cluster bacterium]MDP6514009.1 phosphotransferase [SAR202 cluster bacterium]
MTDTAFEVARRAALSWGISGEPELLKQQENFTFEASSDTGDVIIRVTEDSQRTVAQIESELDWIGYLSREGVNVSAPLISTMGRLVETFETENGDYLASVFAKAPGRPFRFKSDWHPEFHRNLGESIGKMHAAAKSYRPPEGVQPRVSRYDDMRYIESYIPDNDGFARREFDEVMEWASGLEIGPETYGLIHTDMNPGNYFVNNHGNITAFDFDDCSYHWFAYDLAVPVFYSLVHFGLPSPTPNENDWFYGSLLEGYSRHNVLNEDWLRRIPSFVRYRRIEVYLWALKLLDMNNLSDDAASALRRIREGFSIREPLV